MSFTQHSLRVKGDMSQPEGSVMIGMHQSARHGAIPIYEEEVPVMEDRQRLDAAGNPMFMLNKFGQATSPVMERVQRVEAGKPVTAKLRFVLDDLGNGVVTKNYHFAPSEEELARVKAVAATSPEAVSARLTRLEAALEKAGLTVEDAEALARLQEEEKDGDEPRRARRRER
jgi:hypothetical protein